MSDVLNVAKPPFNLDVEQEVIGALLLDDKLMEEVIHRVSPNDFYNPIHKDIYKAMSYLHHNNQLVDFTNVMDRLDYNKVQYDTDYVFNLTEGTITAKSFESKVERLLDLAHKRGLYEVSKFMLTEDIKGVSMENIIKMFNGELEKANLTSNIELTHTKEYVDEWLVEFQKPLANSKIQFGFQELDKLIMLEPTNLGVIAARPGY